MAKKFRKNPEVLIALIPGVGRVSAAMVLEGDQYERFTLPAHGKMLIPVVEVESVADPIPVNVVVQPPVAKPEPEPEVASPEHVVGSAVVDDVTDVGSGVLVDVTDLTPAEALDAVSGTPEAPVLNPSVVDVSDMPPTEAVDALSESLDGGEESASSDESSSDLTETHLQEMSLRKLKKLAAERNIELPKAAKTAEQVREFLRGVLFPTA